MLNRMKERMREYFSQMGNDRESIAKVDRAKKPEEIIQVFVKWYYAHYLYQQNEQFIDFVEFIISNSACDSDTITEEIKDFFILPFAKLKSDEALYNDLSTKEVIAKTVSGVGKSTLVNLERINSNRYSLKLDLGLFCGQLRMNNLFDENRLERILSRLSDDEVASLATALYTLYPSCNAQAKLAIVNYMKRRAAAFKTTYNGFMSIIYSGGYRDEIYYGIMAQSLNKHFDRIRRH